LCVYKDSNFLIGWPRDEYKEGKGEVQNHMLNLTYWSLFCLTYFDFLALILAAKKRRKENEKRSRVSLSTTLSYSQKFM